MYSTESRNDLKKLNELISSQDQVKALRLQVKLGKENFHDNVEKVVEAVTKTTKDVSEDVTKAITESFY